MNGSNFYNSQNSGWNDKAERERIARETRDQKALEKLREKAMKCARRVEAIKKRSGENNFTPELKKALEEFGKANDEFELFEKALTLSDTFADQGIEREPFSPAEHIFHVGDYCERIPVDENRRYARVSVFYNDTTCAEEVEENSSASEKNTEEYLFSKETDAEDAIRLEEILSTFEMAKNDDPETFSSAIEEILSSHISNAEDKIALAKLTGAKDAIAIEAASVQTAINNSLCGLAKRNAEIWTNKAGFAALDIDVDGVSLIRRNGNGDFVYKDKYIVREFPSDILPDSDLGSPVLIGDFKNIVKIVMVGKMLNLDKADLYRARLLDRRRSKEIPILTTTSDEAYINGYIAAE